MAFTLKVEGFSAGGQIPRRFTCDGGDVSPALQWSGEPAETMSFALIFDDPDAPGGVWNHWLVWDIPAEIHALAEGFSDAWVIKTGTNDFGKLGYGGPCPPRLSGPHRYFFRLFATGLKSLDLPEGCRRKEMETALKQHAIGETLYMGRYERR